MFSLRATFVLVIFLFLPFCLRFVGKEPYPAILFPSGASKIKKKEDQISFKVVKYYALDKNGKWVEIDRKAFMFPIPAHYLDYLVVRNLGLKKNGKHNHELKQWIGGKLNDQKFKRDALKIVTYNRTMYVPTGSLIATTINNERIITLSE